MSGFELESEKFEGRKSPDDYAKDFKVALATIELEEMRDGKGWLDDNTPDRISEELDPPFYALADEDIEYFTALVHRFSDDENEHLRLNAAIGAADVAKQDTLDALSIIKKLLHDPEDMVSGAAWESLAEVATANGIETDPYPDGVVTNEQALELVEKVSTKVREQS